MRRSFLFLIFMTIPLVATSQSLQCHRVFHAPEKTVSISKKMTQEDQFNNPITQAVRLVRKALPWRSRNFAVRDVEIEIPYLDRDKQMADAVLLDSGQTLFNSITHHIRWGRHSAISKQNALDSGRSDEVFVSVHSQRQELFDILDREATEARAGFVSSIREGLLNSPTFSNMPRILLTSKDFPIQDPAFVREATRIYYSKHGEIPRQFPLSKVYHVVGEQACACVSRSVRGLIRNAFEKQGEHVEIIIHADYLLTAEIKNQFDDHFQRLDNMGVLKNAGDKRFETALNEILRQAAAALSHRHPGRIERVSDSQFFISFEGQPFSATITIQ